MPRRGAPRTIGSEDSLRLRIQREREKRGWSPAGLADRMTAAGCPMSQPTVWKIEHGDPPRRITVDELVAFANVFEIELADLLVHPDLAASDEAVQIMRQLHELMHWHEDVADQIDKAWHRLAEIIGNPVVHDALRAELAASTDHERDGNDMLEGWIDRLEQRRINTEKRIHGEHQEA